MKRLILCCDGTWNKADQEENGVPCPTNVVKIGYRVAMRDGAIPQIVYYDQGVGSGNILDRYTGGAFGEGLKITSTTPTVFVANYEPGDELFSSASAAVRSRRAASAAWCVNAACSGANSSSTIATPSPCTARTPPHRPSRHKVQEGLFR